MNGEQETEVRSQESEKALRVIDTEHRDNAICPACGDENRDSWELFTNLTGARQVSCGACGARMRVVKDCTITYTTTPLEEPR